MVACETGTDVGLAVSKADSPASSPAAGPIAIYNLAKDAGETKLLPPVPLPMAKVGFSPLPWFGPISNMLMRKIEPETARQARVSTVREPIASPSWLLRAYCFQMPPEWDQSAA